MKPLEFYLVRHGETTWNQEKRMQGQKNSPLTPTGREQAHLLGKKLKHEDFTTAFISPSLRVLETFKLMSENLALTTKQHPDLQEIQMGCWEGQLQTEIAKQAPQEWYNFWHQPELFQGKNSGETFSDLSIRCENFLEMLKREDIGGKVLIVSHRLTIRTMINLLLKQELAQLTELADILPNSLTKIAWDGEKAYLKVYSDVSHYMVID